jgi:hypothetical protein
VVEHVAGFLPANVDKKCFTWAFLGKQARWAEAGS